MKLVIVESPKKCDTIGRYLGHDYKVMASQGHIRDLSTRGKGGLGINVEEGFIPDFIISEGKQKIVADLQKAANKAEEVILATDPDREGEAISWHLAQVLGLDLATTKRLQFHEITKPAILEAIDNPGLINMDLVNSQETRRMYDRVIGFKLSSLLQKKIGSKSAGRVQSVTLRMIVENDEEIKKFVPEEYWTIDIVLDINGTKVTASLDKVDGKAAEIKTKEQAEAIVARIANEYHVTSLTKVKKRTPSKLPFTTSTMQQEAYNRFKFSTSVTQSIAQRLYEGLDVNGEHVGLITYMRTDSTRISENFYLRHAKPFILETFGNEYLGNIKYGKAKENVQDAHEAIRPTGTHRTPEIVSQYLNEKEAKLYRLIYERALASMMSDKVEEVTTAIFEENGLTFKAVGNRTLFKGFEALYREADDETKLLPLIEENAVYKRKSTKNEQKFTKGPARFTEARVVKLMEEKGIGRPSTYASTIKILIERGYVTSKSGVLTPTETGTRTTEVLKQYFPEIVANEYTAKMESELDEIEEGNVTKKEAMDEFYYPFMTKLEEVITIMLEDPDEETGEVCPDCGKPLVYKDGRYGRFIACSNYPTCHYVKKENKVAAKETGEMCPECGRPLVFRKDKKGKEFIACSGFPTCKFVKNIDGTVTTKAKAKFSPEDFVKPCPKCKTGHLVVKHGKKVDFLACTNFPKCHYKEWLTPEKK